MEICKAPTPRLKALALNKYLSDVLAALAYVELWQKQHLHHHHHPTTLIIIIIIIIIIIFIFVIYYYYYYY